MNAKELSRLIAAQGIRPTAQRIRVLGYLTEHPIHASADTIYEALLPENPTFSRTTVYNAVKTLCDAGLIRSLNLDGFSTRYDANVAPHGHFKCNACGRIFDIPLAESLPRIPALADFRVEATAICFWGICPDCAKTSQESGGNLLTHSI